MVMCFGQLFMLYC